VENLYNILGVAASASADEIKKAYRSLAMRHHPDRNNHPTSQARFNAISKAYEVLSDPKKRADYNQTLNNRIVIDPTEEAQKLWTSLFERCGVHLSH